MPRFLLLVVSVGVGACAAPAREMARGPAGPAAPRSFLESVAALVGPIQRETAYEALRPRLSRAALTPSVLFDDASVWARRDGEWRSFDIVGARVAGAYRFGVRAAGPQPSRPADYRERVALRQTGPGRYEWLMDEQLAAGDVRPSDLATALTAFLREAERRDPAAARAAFVATLPRATALLSLLFRVERLRLLPDATGATRVELDLRMDPAALRASAPYYAEFLRKYMTPMRVDASVADSGGTVFWTLSGDRNLWRLRLRVRDGELVPLTGASDRGLPDRLLALIDYDTRMGMFGVGMGRLLAHVELTRAAEEKGLVARFGDEPDWHLPVLVAPLLHGALEHPFSGPGSELALAVRRAPGGATLLAGRYRLRVRESWILRWLGGLASGAVSDFRAGAERESARYQSACVLALRDDWSALVQQTAAARAD